MIVGTVSRDLEATLRLFVRGENGEELEIEAVIDTGFSGFLTLPSAFVASPALTWRGREDALSTGEKSLFGGNRKPPGC